MPGLRSIALWPAIVPAPTNCTRRGCRAGARYAAQEDDQRFVGKVRPVRRPLSEVERAITGGEAEHPLSPFLEGLVRRAGLYAFRQSIEVEAVPMSCFQTALAESHAPVSENVEREYETILAELKRESPTGRRRIGFSVGGAIADADATSA